MAWRRCWNEAVLRRILAEGAPSARISGAPFTPAIIRPKAAPGSLHQGPRFAHGAADAAKSAAARTAPLRGGFSFCTKFTTAVALGAAGIGGVRLYDDYLVFQQVSKKAMARANADAAFKAIVGESAAPAAWYEASVTVDHEGHSAACSFPLSGSLCSASIHLRAVRYEESNSFASFFVLPGSGEWELVVLEALMHRSSSGDQQNPERIDLLRGW